MASFTVYTFKTTDYEEKPELWDWDENRPISKEDLELTQSSYAECWVAPDVDLSQKGWIKVPDVVSQYGNILWVFPEVRRRRPKPFPNRAPGLDADVPF